MDENARKELERLRLEWEKARFDPQRGLTAAADYVTALEQHLWEYLNDWSFEDIPLRKLSGKPATLGDNTTLDEEFRLG